MNLYPNNEQMNVIRKNKTFWGVVGVILLVAGTIWTSPFFLRGGIYLYAIPFTTIAVIVGILLIAWNFQD